MLMGTKVLQSCLPVILNEEKEESWILSFEGLKVLTEFLKFCEGREDIRCWEILFFDCTWVIFFLNAWVFLSAKVTSFGFCYRIGKAIISDSHFLQETK